jgi:probable rRNA maturation factor
MKTSITVPIFVESRYKTNRKRIKETAKRVIMENGVNTPTEISVAIIGNRKMQALNKKYRGIDAPTNILSFPQSESFEDSENERFLFTEKLYLGDVVISYPIVIAEASQYNKLVDDWTCELVEHGVKHLLGIHHA